MTNQQNKQNFDDVVTEFYTGQRVMLVEFIMNNRFGRHIPDGSLGTVQQVEPVRVRGRIEGQWVDMETVAVVVVFDALPYRAFAMGPFEIAPADVGAVA